MHMNQNLFCLSNGIINDLTCRFLFFYKRYDLTCHNGATHHISFCHRFSQRAFCNRSKQLCRFLFCIIIFNINHLICQFVFNLTARFIGTISGNNSRHISGCQHFFFYIRMYGSFSSCHKSGTHLKTFCAHGNSGCDTTSICQSAAGDNRNIQKINCLWN